MKHVVIMSKAPKMGRTKTRLAANTGPVQAAAFHRKTLFHVAQQLNDNRWMRWLAVTPDAAASQPRLWPDGWAVIPQGRGDLGDRMLRPLAQLPPGPVVIIGSDIPDITADHIAAAFAALGENDWVFGPATDGGYWLVGAKRRPRLVNPFQGVRWSTEHARADTLANLPDETKIGFLETLSDVDE
ncbi:TIGR04282 family arsenosugar biosynthesis glycosyltransferase [Magnetovibrio sp. PR-2]|uniref:TIGR04282 family arsenosugar biosynthesis glycosyltransferase n=1 Tax=Magnetovibrio sp. PR-2 TaxID=3120356 RepID=UPI002FCDF74D